MREILFKAKRKDNGEWIEGGYAEHDGKVFIVTWVRYIPDTRDWDTADYYENNPHYNSSLNEVIPETVCQYAETKDRDGKKIFEGDIVKLDISYVGGAFREYICVVNLDKFGVTFQDVKNQNNCLSYGEDVGESDISIIGNIYDNPELM